MPLDNSSSSLPNPWEKSYPAGLSWDEEIPELTMVDIFETAVKKYKDRAFLDFMGKELTYKQVGEMVDRFAKGLQDQGIKKGSKVGLCLPNSPFYVIAYNAALKIGATVVNFNPLYAEKEMEHQIRDSDAEVMVTLNLAQIYPKVGRMLGEAKLKKIIVCDMPDALPKGQAIGYRAINRLSALTRHLPFIGKKIRGLRDKKGIQPTAKIKKNKNIVSFKKLLASKGAPKPVDIQPDDLAVLQYTGGTTGVPKAAMLSHGNLASNVQQAALWFTGGKERPKQDTIVAVLPFFHVFAMNVLLNMGTHLGAKIALLPKFDLKNTLGAIAKHKATIFAAVPPLYDGILNSGLLQNYDMSSLEVCISGGAPLPGSTMTAFKEKTGITLLEGYGLSECSAAAIANPLHGERKPGSIGLPLPRTEIKLVPLPDADASIKMVGEICLRGPQIMKGYWKNPKATAEMIDKEGWLHTGDVGRMDAQGYTEVIGRIKDMIIVNGMKAFPFKIENAILEHPAVAGAAVIGVPDPLRQEAVKAFIVLEKGMTLTASDLKKFLDGRLSNYEIPSQVEYRDALPLTVIGKPDKKVLKQEEADKAAAAKAGQPPKPRGGSGPRPL